MSDCPRPGRVDGNDHSWRWYGDDPIVECYYCGHFEDAINGYVFREGQPQPATQDIQCPWCDVFPGDPCVMPSGKVRRLGPHQRRIDAAARPAGARR